MKTFQTEAELCAAFVAHNQKEWTAYSETAGFDILMVRKSDGFQVGVEAKLRLNAKVICQAAESQSSYQVNMPGPDCRAVLVPYDKAGELAAILPLLHITCIRFGIEVNDYLVQFGKPAVEHVRQYPDLPRENTLAWEQWYECAPAKRCELPDYIPDVCAGHSGPIKLTDWKVRAIKIAITLDKVGHVTRADFKRIGIDMTRWTQGSWIYRPHDGKVWVKGSQMPDFKAQHPINYSQIEADYEKWGEKA